MALTIARIVVGFLAVYAAAGLVFALPFLRKGAARLDPAAEGVSVATRLLWLPGVVALWPVLLVKGRRG